jgi:hypothetical protein
MVRFCTQQAFDPIIRDVVETTTTTTTKSVEENDNGAKACSSVTYEFDAPSSDPGASRDDESPRNGQIPAPSDHHQVLGSIWPLPSSDDDRWEDNIDTRKRSSSWKDDEDEKNTAVAPSVKHDWSTDPTMWMVLSDGNGALPREERFNGIFGSANPPSHHAAYLNSNLAHFHPIEMQTNNRKDEKLPPSNDDDENGEKVATAGAVACINDAKRFKQTNVSSGLASSAVHTVTLPSPTPPVFTQHPIPSIEMPIANVATLPPPEDANAVYFDMMRHGATQKLRDVVQRFAIHHDTNCPPVIGTQEDMVHEVRAILRRESGIDQFFLLEHHHPIHHHPRRGRSEEQPIHYHGNYTWRLATEEEILQKIWQLLVNVRCWREAVRRRDLMQRGQEPSPLARNMAQDRRAGDPPHLKDRDEPDKADAEEIMGDMDTVRREYLYYDTHYQRMLADTSHHRWKPQEIETVQQARNIYKKLLDQRERIVVGNLHVGSLDSETKF